MENIAQELTAETSNLVDDKEKEEEDTQTEPDTKIQTMELPVTQGETTTAELLTSLKKLDNKSNSIAQDIAKIQKDLQENHHQIHNLETFSHLFGIND